MGNSAHFTSPSLHLLQIKVGKQVGSSFLHSGPGPDPRRKVEGAVGQSPQSGEEVESRGCFSPPHQDQSRKGEEQWGKGPHPFLRPSLRRGWAVRSSCSCSAPGGQEPSGRSSTANPLPTTHTRNPAAPGPVQKGTRAVGQ